MTIGPIVEQDGFSRKFLIPDYRGLSVLKRCILSFFCLFSKTPLKNFPNCLHECRGQLGPSFEPDCFSEKFLIPDYRRVSVLKR